MNFGYADFNNRHALLKLNWNYKNQGLQFKGLSNLANFLIFHKLNENFTKFLTIIKETNLLPTATLCTLL